MLKKKSGGFMKDNKAFLRHILDEIRFLLKETKDLEFNEFMENELLSTNYVTSQ